MSSEVDEELIIRTSTRIRQLKEFLQRGYFILFPQGDPDFPDGVKLPIPKTWKTQIKSCIKTLNQKRKDEIAKETS